MKNIVILTITVFCISLNTYLLAVQPIASSPNGHVVNNYQNNLIIANESIIELIDLSKAFEKGTISLKRLQLGYLKTRAEFKKVEFLIEYFNHEIVKSDLNGPVSNDVYLDQKGLQLIDIMVFSPEAIHEKQAIYEAISKFGSDFFEISNQHILLSPSDLNVFEACRDELIRLYAIGLSGFETRGSNNSFADAVTVIKTLENNIGYYLNSNKYPELTSKIKQSFNGAIANLKNAYYLNSFDRIGFLRSYINPLYKDLYHLQVKLGYDEPKEST